MLKAVTLHPEAPLLASLTIHVLAEAELMLTRRATVVGGDVTFDEDLQGLKLTLTEYVVEFVTSPDVLPPEQLFELFRDNPTTLLGPFGVSFGPDEALLRYAVTTYLLDLAFGWAEYRISRPGPVFAVGEISRILGRRKRYE